jgi:hypothetical protein
VQERARAAVPGRRGGRGFTVGAGRQDALDGRNPVPWSTVSGNSIRHTRPSISPSRLRQVPMSKVDWASLILSSSCLPWTGRTSPPSTARVVGALLNRSSKASSPGSAGIAFRASHTRSRHQSLALASWITLSRMVG